MPRSDFSFSMKLVQNEGTCFVVKLAITVDAGEAFVNPCYTLKGDGSLVLNCYEVLSTVRASIHWLNT